MAVIIEADDLSFDNEVKQSELPVLVDFYATWCAPCRNQLAILDDLASASDKFKIVKVNVDGAENKSREFNISSIPSLKVFVNGSVVEEMLGVHSKDMLLGILSKYTN